MKRFKSTYILAGVAIAFVLYAYFFEYKREIKENKVKEEQSRLFGIAPTEVVELKLQWAAGHTELKKEDGKWRIVSPIKDDVDAGAISTLLSGIETDSSETTVSSDPNVDLKIYGLKDPLGTVEIKTQSGTSKTVSFGTVDALDGKKYAYANGKVVLISSFIQNRFIKSPRDLRLKKIQRATRDDIVTLDIKQKGMPTVSLQKDSGHWKYKDKKWDVDSALVEQYLGKIENLNAQDFVAEEKNLALAKKQFKLPMNLLALDLHSSKGEKEEITIHSIDKAHAIVTTSRSPVVYKVVLNQYEALKLKSEQDFRDHKKPFEFKKENIEQIDVKTDLLKLSLNKRSGHWESVDKLEGKTIDQPQVSKLIEAIGSLKVEQFFSSKPLGQVKGEIVLKTKDNQEELTLRWGAESQDVRLVQTNKLNEVVGVSKISLASLPIQTLLQEVKDKKQESESINKKKTGNK